MSIACHLPAAQQAPSICLSLSCSLIKCEGFRIWHHIRHLRKMCYLFSPKSVPHRGRGNHKSTLRKLLQDDFFSKLNSVFLIFIPFHFGKPICESPESSLLSTINSTFLTFDPMVLDKVQRGR